MYQFNVFLTVIVCNGTGTFVLQSHYCRKLGENGEDVPNIRQAGEALVLHTAVAKTQPLQQAMVLRAPVQPTPTSLYVATNAVTTHQSSPDEAVPAPNTSAQIVVITHYSRCCNRPPLIMKLGWTASLFMSLTTTTNSSVFSHFNNIHRLIPKTFIWRSFEGLSQLPDMILLMYLPNQPPSPISWALLRSSGLMLQICYKNHDIFVKFWAKDKLEKFML